jgi:hypothetical protein
MVAAGEAACQAQGLACRRQPSGRQWRDAAASQPPGPALLCPPCTESHASPTPPDPISSLRSPAYPLRCWPAPAPCCTPARTGCAPRLPACRWGAQPTAASGAAPAQPPAPRAVPCRSQSSSRGTARAAASVTRAVSRQHSCCCQRLPGAAAVFAVPSMPATTVTAARKPPH